MRQIALDTETTGLEPKDGHRIIEIGCVEIINRKITQRTLQFYLNPDREIDQGAIAVHGITNEFLKDKPRFNEVVNEFLDFITDAELIIHNAAFDLGFFNHELARANIKRVPLESHHNVIDTLMMARKLHPGQKNNLDALCKRYDVDNSQRQLHGALLDAMILARVYLAMTSGQSSFAFSNAEHPNEFANNVFANGVVTSTNSAAMHSAQNNKAQLNSTAEHNAVNYSPKPATMISKVNEEELIAHQEFLAFLTKQQGGDKPIEW